jgi:hypothetical protein
MDSEFNRTSTRGSGVRYGALAVGSCRAGPRGARWWDSKEGEPAPPLGERGEALLPT